MSPALAAVAPVFATVALGYGVARAGLFTHEATAGLTRFMYYLAIPAMLFRSLAGADLPASVPWAFLASYYLPALVVFALARAGAVRWRRWPRRDAAIAGMGAAYANMVLLGLPLVLNAWGEAALVPLFVLLATQSLVFFPLTTVLLEARADPDRHLARRLVPLALNPVLISLALGICANLRGIGVPAAVDTVLAPLAAAAPACALVALGLSLAHYRAHAAAGDVALLVALKMLLQPLAVFLAGRVLGVDGAWLAVAVLLAAMPCSVNAFIFSSQYHVREGVIARAVVVSTVLCAGTATVLIGWLGPVP